MGRAAQKKASNRGVTDALNMYKTAIASGLDPRDVARLTSLIYCITDIAETLSLELIKKLKGSRMSFKDGEDLKLLNRYARSLQKSASVDLIKAAKQDDEDPNLYAIDFGDTSDFIKSALEITTTIRKEDRMKALSTLKMFVKKT